jgi:hypothetical protein
MKKIILKRTLLFLMFSISNSFFGQELVKMYGGSNYDRVNSIIQTSDGGYLLGGFSDSTDGYITDTPNGNTDVIVHKVTNNGTIIWQKNYGGSEYDSAKIYSTGDGGAIGLGFTLSNNGDINNNNGDGDIWLFRINAQGDLLWSKTFGGNSFDDARDLIINTDGSFTIVGRTTSINFLNNNSFGSEYKYFILKVDSTGNTILPGSSVFEVNGAGGVLNSVKALPDGTLWIAGTNFPQNSNDSEQIVIKMSNTGSIIFSTIIPSFDPDYDQDTFTYSQILNDGSFIVSGQLFSNNTFDMKGTLCKIDSTGNVIWQKEYSEISISSFNVDTNGNIWATGFGAVNYDAFCKLSKINPINGDLLNDYSFGGVNDNSDTFGTNISIQPDNKILIVGYTDSNTGVFQGLLNSLDDGFLLRIDPTTLNIEINEMNTFNILLYPNPTSDVLNIKNDSNISLEKINIIDSLGKIVMEITNDFQTIRTNNLQQGLYLMQIISKDYKVINKKFVKK